MLPSDGKAKIAEGFILNILVQFSGLELKENYS